MTPDLRDLDINEIIPGLYQGSKPPEGSTLHDRGFDVVVLCANDYQPHVSSFPGLAVIRAPYEDSDRVPTEFELDTARDAAIQIVERLEREQIVLVTCIAGLNRSGLVTGMALHLLYNWHGEQCLKHVQEQRIEALFNEGFVQHLRSLRPKIGV